MKRSKSKCGCGPWTCKKHLRIEYNEWLERRGIPEGRGIGFNEWIERLLRP